MAFTLTEEQKQEILDGLKKNPDFDKRTGPYDSWAGIELQLERANSDVEAFLSGQTTTNIFYMTCGWCPSKLAGSRGERPLFQIHKVVVEDR